MWAADAAVLVSHRYDLVRFWNGGAACSYYTMAPDRKHGPGAPALLRRPRTGLRHRAHRRPVQGRAGVHGGPNPKVDNVVMEAQGDAVEVHLPPVSQYVALELDV